MLCNSRGYQDSLYIDWYYTAAPSDKITIQVQEKMRVPSYHYIGRRMMKRSRCPPQRYYDKGGLGDFMDSS